ncbi:MAG: histidine kinase [Bacteroidetes bacterium]|nr:histidine kinase [Bacteroidota bacterium]
MKQKTIWNRILKNFWLRNVLVFICFLFARFIFNPEDTILGEVKATVSQLILLIFIIFHNRILINGLLLKNRKLLYLVLLLVLIIVYSLLQGVMYNQILLKERFISLTYVAIYNFFLGAIVYFTYLYFIEQQKILENKLYIVEMEQKYLKNQLSPHFIFNSLNNIYYYSLEESKRTPELILKLSELIRFLNEFNKKPKITIKEELSFLDSYLLFERERLEDRCEINYQCEINKPNRAIEPLLFFPLIENAFKHGTNTMEKCFVNIKVREVNDTLSVIIENRILNADIVSTRTGKENVQRRLDLFYPNKHSLLVTKENGTYKVDLKIELRNEYIDI